MADSISPVQLPDLIDGVPLEWLPWELAPVMTHVPFDCIHCDFDGPPATAFGTSPEQRGRWLAIRCRRCQATTVRTWKRYTTWQPGISQGEYTEVWSSPQQPYTPTPEEQ